MMGCSPVLVAIVFLPLAGCAHLDNKGRSYAGSRGSTFDAALNPPQANGVVSYNPSIPVKPHDYGNSGDARLSASGR